MHGRIRGARCAAVLVAAMALGLICAAGAQADESPTASASVGVAVTNPDLAAGLTLELWLPGAKRTLDEMLASTGRPSPERAGRLESTLERLLASGAPADPQVAAALNEVLDSLRTLIERLVADPGGTSAAVLRSLIERFNELVKSSSGDGSTSSTGTISTTTPAVAAVLGTSTAGTTRVTRRRAVVTRMRLLRGRRAVKITVRCPAQVASSCQVTVLARVQRRASTRARRIAIRSGTSKAIQLRFTKAGRRAVRRGGRLSGVVRTRFGTTTLTSARATRVSRLR